MDVRWDDKGRGVPTTLTPEALGDALLGSLRDGVYVVDAEGRLLWMNPAAEDVLGYGVDELRGMDMHDAVHPRTAEGEHLARRDCPLLAVTQRGESVELDDQVFVHRDGHCVPVFCTSSAVLDAGRVVGAVVVFRDVSKRLRAESERDRLSRERSAIAEALQRPLLPVALPDVPGVTMAASFRPVGEQVLAGGDFYDAFPAGGGHWVIVGDIAGKGSEAAAVAGAVRTLLRGLGRARIDAGAALQVVSAELLAHPSQRFCTLALVELVADGERVSRARVLAAGHPLPVLLRDDGRVVSVGIGGSVLGVLEAPEWPVAEFSLAPGDSLVLFTDGLLDARRPEHPEQFEVAPALAGLSGLSAAEVVTRLEDAGGLLEIDEPTDDVAILVVQHGELGATTRPSPARPVRVAQSSDEVGATEAAFRDANERVRLGRAMGTNESVAFLCECGYEDCRMTLELPPATYERLRDDPRRFAVVPGHELPEVEDVVERHTGYVVVEKRSEAGEAAEARNPRH